MKVTIIGAGAGGAAAAVETLGADHDVVLWNRSPETLAPFQALGGVGYEGVLGEGVARPRLITADLSKAIRDADVAVVTLPTFSHAPTARALVAAGWGQRPVVLNPGHTGGALEFAEAWRNAGGGDPPPVAEFSTLTYVARKYQPDRVTVTGRARRVRAAALPGGQDALTAAIELFPGAEPVGDVLFSDLCNVNMVLHTPGAVLGAAWVEATGGDFTFYVQGMTPGVARVMRTLDDERRAVGRALGHDLPSLIEEMRGIGTVEASVTDFEDFVAAIAGGKANARIKAPGDLTHRYYREDFGHGLLPFREIARIAGVDIPVANSLFALAEAATGVDYRATGRTAAAMGLAGLDRDGLLRLVRGG